MLTKLIIVGNGYDLARGLKTSYDDFFRWLDKNNDQSIITDTLINIKNKNFQGILEKDNVIVKNFWYTYMKLLKLHNQNWNDVEGILLSALEPISEEYNHMLILKKNSAKIKELLIDFEYNKKVFSLLISNVARKNKPFNIYDYLFSELKKFESDFKNYLDGPAILNKNKKCYGINFQNLLGDTPEKDISVLNFNYTYLVPNLPESQFRNIHGLTYKDLPSEIIFGIDNTEITPSDEIYRFTKAARIMMNSYDKKYSSILSHDIKEVAFVGHSLAKADYSYFQSIFDYLSIYDSAVTLVFYYTNYHASDATKMSEYQDAIQALIERYGETLDNKKHGDNLHTKLILENRLKMINIQ